MAESLIASSIRALAIRLTLLDDCGKPVDTTATTKTQLSFASFMSLSFSPDIEEGEKIREKRADGKLCVIDNEDCPKLVGAEITLMLCDASPYVLELLAGAAPLANNNGDISGFVLPGAGGMNGVGCPNRVLLEIWTTNSGRRCDSNGEVAKYIRYIFPYTLNWRWTNDHTLENGVTHWELKGYAEANEQFKSPIPNDSDLTPANILAIQNGGPVAVVVTNTLPEINDGNWANP